LQRYASRYRQQHQQRRAAAQRQRRAHEQGQQRQQPRRPGDLGAGQTGRAPRGDGGQPSPGDRHPGIHDHAGVTAREAPNCLHAPNVAPGQAMCIIREAAWIHPCG